MTIVLLTVIGGLVIYAVFGARGLLRLMIDEDPFCMPLGSHGDEVSSATADSVLANRPYHRRHSPSTARTAAIVAPSSQQASIAG